MLRRRAKFEREIRAHMKINSDALDRFSEISFRLAVGLRRAQAELPDHLTAEGRRVLDEIMRDTLGATGELRC